MINVRVRLAVPWGANGVEEVEQVPLHLLSFISDGLQDVQLVLRNQRHEQIFHLVEKRHQVQSMGVQGYLLKPSIIVIIFQRHQRHCKRPTTKLK